MSTLTFDTLKFAKRLTAAGIPPAQAEAEAEALAEALTESTKAAELVTKPDLAAALAELKTDMVKWFAGMLIAQAALIAALVKLI